MRRVSKTVKSLCRNKFGQYILTKVRFLSSHVEINRSVTVAFNMIFDNGRIVLDSKNETFYAGQVVSGKLEFDLETSIMVSSIHVNFVGETLVEWTEYEMEEYQAQSRRYPVAYRGREEYFNFVQYLLGGPQGAPVVLPAGKYSYPFQYQTPYVCPSSFVGSRGKVWYRVVASAAHTGPGDATLVKEFQLVAPLDLNKDVDAQKPIDLEFEAVYSCCLCESGALRLRVSIPHSGYCPGQRVPIRVDADNGSSVEVHKLVFTLRKAEAYHSQQPQSDYEMADEVIARVKMAAIPANSERHFTAELEVPDMVAPNLDSCGLIDYGYTFKVEIEVSGCNDGTEDEADFVIGLVPIADTHCGYEHPMRHRLPEGEPPTAEPAPTAIGFVGGAYPGGAYPGGAYPGGAYPGGAYPGYAYAGADAGDVRPPPYESLDLVAVKPTAPPC